MNYPYHFQAQQETFSETQVARHAELFYKVLRGLDGVKDVVMVATDVKVIVAEYSEDFDKLIMELASENHMQLIPQET